MAWSWNHTQCAYACVQLNVEDKSKEWLDVVYAEWQAAENDEHENLDINNFNKDKYKKALVEADKLPDDVLADYIWERMSEAAICENGGHNAWACPSGCGPHLIPFELPVDKEEIDRDKEWDEETERWLEEEDDDFE